MQVINRRLNTAEYIQGVLSGDRAMLSRAITIVESNNARDRSAARDILRALMAYKHSTIRLGITGAPGVGKSTFIECLGEYLLSIGRRVAVLAVDPSSRRSGGSILGDKTRMTRLCTHQDVFIRPSPAGDQLGGVARSTRDNIVLCEAAGYDVVMVETVGVGQSETLVRSMVDFFMLLLLPGAGDALQGMKRGIMEMADGLVINKADGDLLQKAGEAQINYSQALHLFPKQQSEWATKVLTCSATEGEGIEPVWEMVDEYRALLQGNGCWERNRQRQQLTWFREQLAHVIHVKTFEHKENRQLKHKLEGEIERGECSPSDALERLVRHLFQKER